MILRWIGSLIVVAVLAMLGLAGWTVGTEAGAAWLAREAEFFSDGAIRVRGIHGSLAAGLEVDDLAIVAGPTTLSGQGLAVRFVPAALLSGRLSVSTLRAQRIELVIPPASPPAGGPFRTPELSVPFPVEVDDLLVGILAIRSGPSTQTVTNIHVAGSMHDTRLELRRLQGGLLGLDLRAEGSVRFEPGLPVDARVEWALADPALSGAGTIRGNLTALEVMQIIHLPEAVTVAGTLYDVVAGPRVKGTATWDDIQLGVPGIGGVHASAGRATLEGTLKAWHATLAATARPESMPVMQAQVTAHGDDGQVVFDELRLDSDSGAVRAQGDLVLTPERRLRLEIIASNIATAAFRRGLNGNLSARVKLDAMLPGEVQVKVIDLRGRLMGRPLAGSGDVAYGDGLLAYNDVTLRAGPNRLRASGSIGDRLAGGFELEAPDLAVLWPGLSGSLAAHATLAGTRARPVVDVEAHGNDLRQGGNSVARLELRARVDQRQAVEADLSAQGIGADGRVIGNLEAGVNGTLDEHSLVAHLSGGMLDVQLSSAGGWNGTTLHHRIGSASVAIAALGQWRLSGQPAVAVRADSATVADHCWEQAPAVLCLSGLSWSPGHTHLVAELRDFDLQRLDQWLAHGLALTGRGYAVMSMEMTAAGLTGSAIWRQEETTVTYSAGDELLVTPLQTVQVAAQFTPADVRATLELHAESGLHLSGSGRILAPFSEDAALDAQIVGRLPDIATFVPWFAGDLDLAEVAGRVTLDAAVTGSVREPRVTGEVRLAGGAVALPGLGVKLDAIDVALLGDGSPTLKLQGTAKAGGDLALDGEVLPIEKSGPEGWVRIRGNAVDAVRLPDMLVQATPDITLRYAGGQLRTEGSVTIPKAEIVVRQLPESAASPSRDAVVRDREAPAAGSRQGQTIGGEVAITLGRDVRLKAFGLDTLLEGTVKLSQGPEGELQGFGVLRLREGKFGAYGKELVIERGTLGFAGPLDDPAIDVRATRRVDWEGKSVTAGILLTGTASQPESRVFSDPAMSEADALSYLISGRPMQSANTTDRSAIAGAALSLGVQQTSPLTQAIGSAVTLDELGMEGGTLDETKVVAGKQIGSDLYVRFAYGLFNRIGTVLARYKIGRNLSIEAASGEDQSLDLIYSVEKD